MLVELTIDDFAIIRHLQIEFGSGFNVLTGETGAGKSIIVDAVAALLGDKLEQEHIRAGADATSIEGVFSARIQPSSSLWQSLSEHGLIAATREPSGPPGDDQLIILRRDLRLNGRSVCRVNGRAVPLKVLQEIGQHLVDIHGQGEHILLLRRREQLRLLDRYAGLDPLQQQVAAKARELRQIRQELASLRRDERELARHMDILRYEVDEITSARLLPGEEEELGRERDRLANAEKLAAWAEAACALLYEGDAEIGLTAVDQLGRALQLLHDLARIDPALEPQRQAAESAVYLVDDIARTLRTYREELEFDPRRLEQVESRFALVHSLQRKFGDSIPEVLAYAERAQAELGQMEHTGERLETLEAYEEALLRQIGTLGHELSLRRQEAACRLAAEVEKELSELRMEHARFSVHLGREEAEDGAWVDSHRFRFDTTGLDQAEFLVSTNPGEPLRHLNTVASGGETSRLMLALKTVLAHADDVPTMVFDEIDAGIGGVVGGTVGQKLRQLARRHQVLCVTHLPQLAAAGMCQFKIEKKREGERTTTHARRLSAEERVGEIALMLGAQTEATLESARELLAKDLS